MFVNDFQIISSLRVIERANLDALLKEHELSQTGKVDKSTAIEIGKLLGAQLMVFGSITQLDDKHTRMVARAVKVETSEIITSVDIEGKPEYFKLEKELVKQLADKLDIDLNKKTMELIDKNGTDSDEAANFYAKGLYFMDRYDYSNAYDNFKKAYEIDDEFVQAKNMLDTYQPLVGFLVNK
ncbi:MAG: CsgG/HfaB family protein, partial [Candidatus Zixiibacteriota bacterium]